MQPDKLTLKALDPLSTKLLEGEFKPGAAIRVAAKGDELEFSARN